MVLTSAVYILTQRTSRCHAFVTRSAAKRKRAATERSLSMSQRDCGSGPAVTNPRPSLRPCAVVLCPRAGLRVWARSDVLTIGTVGRARSDEPTTVTLALRRRPVQSLPGCTSLMIVCAPRPDHAPMPTQLLCTQPRLRAGLDAHPPKVLKVEP